MIRDLDGVALNFLQNLNLTKLGELAYLRGESRLVVKLMQQILELTVRYDIIWFAIESKNPKNSLEVQFLRDSAFKFAQLQTDLIDWIKANVIGKAD